MSIDKNSFRITNRGLALLGQLYTKVLFKENKEKLGIKESFLVLLGLKSQIQLQGYSNISRVVDQSN